LQMMLSEPTMTERNDAPNCWQCQFFQITHVAAFPYACRAIGFKSKQLPCLDVLRVDGRACRQFIRKQSPR
jgi:hypothetical protein